MKTKAGRKGLSVMRGHLLISKIFSHLSTFKDQMPLEDL